MYLRKSFSDKVIDLLLFVILVVITLLSLAPILYIFALSFSEKSAAAAGLVTFFPVGFTVSPYKYLMRDQIFYKTFLVSVKRVLLGGGINFILTILTAYPLSKDSREFKLRNGFMWMIVFTMMFSGGLIPWYMVVKWTGIYDTIWALVLPGAVPVFNVILLMNFFRGIPRGINEAAIIDGAGPWQTLFSIYVPVSLPAISTVTLFSTVGHWNAFFDGMILIGKMDRMPLQTYIQQLVVKPYTNSSAFKVEELAKLSERTFNAAKIVITMIPILLIYPLLQRYFISGITLGSIKE